MKTFPDDYLTLLAETAQLYYVSGLDQAAIAQEKGVSRSSISRMLGEARELGIVEFRINFPLRRNAELERALQEAFDLENVAVLKTAASSPEQRLSILANFAADLLKGRLRDGMVIGTTWGRTVHAVVNAMPRMGFADLNVVQIIGAMGGNQQATDSITLIRDFADRLGGRPHYIHTPLVVADVYVRQSLLKDRATHATLELARNADLLVTGAGTLEAASSAPLRAGYLSEAELERAAEAGGVGEFCGHYIDAQGQPLEIPFNARIMGLTLDEIANIPQVMTVASGKEKAPTLRGVLHRGLVSTLVLDEETAQAVLESP